MPKRTIILVAVALISFWFWFSVKPWIQDPSWSTINYQTWLWPLIALVVTGAVFANALALLDRTDQRWLGSGIVGATFLLVFGISTLNLLGVVLMFAFHSFAMRAMRNAVQNHVKIDFRAGAGHGMRNVILPLLIMLSFVYFENPEVQASAQQSRLPESITKAVETASRFLADSELSQLSPAQRAQVEDQLTKETVSFLERQAKPYRKFFPPVLAFGLFLVLQGLGFILIPIAVFLAWALFESLRASEFIRVSERDVKAEVISLN